MRFRRPSVRYSTTPAPATPYQAAQQLWDERIGGAEVSAKHANFIVNPKGRAKAADIESIIAHVRAVVRAQTGVDLEPEVQVLGERQS